MLDNTQKKEIKKLIAEYLEDYAQVNQYGVSTIPFHTHNGVDSPLIAPASFPVTEAENDWQFSGTFSSNGNPVSWTSGTLLDRLGNSYSISSGSAETIANLTYVYFDSAASITVFQTTTDPATAVGINKILIGVFNHGMPVSTGTAIFVDNFNSYTNGLLNGQGGWAAVGGGSFYVQGVTVYEGAKAILADGVNHGAGNPVAKTGTLTAAGGFTIFVNSQANAGFHILLSESAAAGLVEIIGGVAGTTTGSFSYKDSTNNTVAFGTNTYNLWQKVDIEWHSAPSHRVRYRVDDGTWTSFVLPNQDWTTGLDTITIQNLVSKNFYFDTIQSSSIFQSAPFQIYGGSGGFSADNTHTVGATGTFVDGSANTVTVINGLITSLM